MLSCMVTFFWGLMLNFDISCERKCGGLTCIYLNRFMFAQVKLWQTCFGKRLGPYTDKTDRSVEIVLTNFTRIYTYTPWVIILPRYWISPNRFDWFRVVVQFHRSNLNCRWHSQIPLRAPSLTHQMDSGLFLHTSSCWTTNPGTSLQPVCCSVPREPSEAMPKYLLPKQQHRWHQIDGKNYQKHKANRLQYLICLEEIVAVKKINKRGEDVRI